MAASNLADLYDAHYYRTYRGAPYERSDLWLTLFGAVADGIVREINPATALDVGCAIGLLVAALRERGVEAYGLDLSPYAVEQVQEDVKAHCWAGSVLDAPTRRYDLVICHEVLEHLPPEDAHRAVGNLCQMADDILFSSSPDDFAEDTHLNVRPPEYWAGLFAQHGFVRDVDFDPLGIVLDGVVRFRKTAEPLHRIVASFERGFARLALENVALRKRAVETKRLLAQQDRAAEERATSNADIAALEMTIAEQTAHLDAQAERLMYMSDREGDLRAMLHDAHEQLIQRDESLVPLQRELDARGAVIEELDRAVRERTAWAERMVTEAEARGRIIEELQAALDAQGSRGPEASAAPGSQDVAALHQLVAERTAWAERMVAEAEARGRVIEELQAALDRRDQIVDVSRRGGSRRKEISKEAEAVAARLDTAPVRRLVRGYRRLRRLV